MTKYRQTGQGTWKSYEEVPQTPWWAWVAGGFVLLAILGQCTH